MFCVHFSQRLQDAHDEVKRRLDYQLEVSNANRRLEQKHMVDWILTGVRESITPEQEKQALKTGIAELKKLAKAQ